jgi:hypothetical protein
VVGFVVLAVDLPYLDVTVRSFSSSRGVELSDVIGAVALIAGVVTLW